MQFFSVFLKKVSAAPNSGDSRKYCSYFAYIEPIILFIVFRDIKRVKKVRNE